MQSGLKWNNISPTGRFPKKKSPCIFSHVPSAPKKRESLRTGTWLPTSAPGPTKGVRSQILQLLFLMQKNSAVGGKLEKKNRPMDSEKVLKGSSSGCTVARLILWTYELPHGHDWVDAQTLFDAALREFVCQQKRFSRSNGCGSKQKALQTTNFVLAFRFCTIFFPKTVFLKVQNGKNLGPTRPTVQLRSASRSPSKRVGIQPLASHCT